MYNNLYKYEMDSVNIISNIIDNMDMNLNGWTF